MRRMGMADLGKTSTDSVESSVLQQAPLHGRSDTESLVQEQGQ